MIRPTRESTYTDTLVPDPTLSRSSVFNGRRSDAGPGAEPGNPPADTEQGRPADKAGGEIGFGRQMKLSSGDRFGHAGHDAPRDRHDNDGAAHDESEGGIPVAEDVEKTAYTRRIGHAAKGKACAE